VACVRKVFQELVHATVTSSRLHQSQEVIFTITEFEFTPDDPNKEGPVTLYCTFPEKEVYMGCFESIHDARMEIESRGVVHETESVNILGENHGQKC
jgi:hypothetical protein